MATSLRIQDHNVVISGGPIRVGRLEQEWYTDVGNPEELIAPLAEPASTDIFTFWQRLPDVTPRVLLLHGVRRNRGPAPHLVPRTGGTTRSSHARAD